MLLKELYEGMYGKINEIGDDEIIKYDIEDKDGNKTGEKGQMSAKAAKRMEKDHPAKKEYEKLKGDGGGAKKKSVNIFDKPEDKPEDKPKAKPKDIAGSIADIDDWEDREEAGRLAGNLAQGFNTDSSHQELTDMGLGDLADAIMDADSDEEKSRIIAKASGMDSDDDMGDEDDDSQDDASYDEFDMEMAQDDLKYAKEDLEFAQEEGDEEGIAKAKEAIKKAEKEIAKLRGESISFREIKENWVKKNL